MQIKEKSYCALCIANSPLSPEGKAILTEYDNTTIAFTKYMQECVNAATKKSPNKGSSFREKVFFSRKRIEGIIYDMCCGEYDKIAWRIIFRLMFAVVAILAIPYWILSGFIAAFFAVTNPLFIKPKKFDEES